jgi:subtilisin family serine protease
LPKIDRRPAADPSTVSKIDTLPKRVEFQGINLQNSDLSSMDLSNKKEELLDATFNSKTVFPKKMPEGFNPSKIMEMGKNPGLGIRKLHKEGITGKGVNIAIIDQPLLFDHQEYKNKIVFYEEINICPELFSSSMHGPAVTSLAVGNTVGVAPSAKVFYIAQYNFDTFSGNNNLNFKSLVQAIDRIIEVNHSLPIGEKIRVISISRGISNDPAEQKENDTYRAAIKRAEDAGIFVVWVDDGKSNLNLEWLGRYPDQDPEKPQNYSMSLRYKEFKYNPVGVYVPADSRTYASAFEKKDYIWSREGGMSWTCPYYAGIYALACQVYPQITPEQFRKIAWETKTPITVNDTDKDGKQITYTINGIVNPVGIIEKVKSLAETAK